MLSHPNITVVLNTDFFQVDSKVQREINIFTGPIDNFFSKAALPKLEYRSLRFESVVMRNVPYFQSNSVVNYPEAQYPWTRIVEHKHFLSQPSPDTVVTREFPSDTGEPYYPVPSPRNQDLYRQYKELAANESRYHFIGRLANYKYFNMDAAIGNALTYYETYLGEKSSTILHHEYIPLIQQQASARHAIIKEPLTSEHGMLVVTIQDNKIDKVRDGIGFIHPDRKRQHLSFLADVLRVYKVPNCTLNINMDDHPREGAFNFCRTRGNAKQFLIPNSRFSLDDTIPPPASSGIKAFQNFDDEVAYVRSLDTTPFQSKLPRTYTSSVPHRPKCAYFLYAAKNRDICDGVAFIGPPHKIQDLSVPEVQLLTEAGLTRSDHHAPFLDHLKYKYVIYNDGNTLSDRTRLLLVLNAVTIRSSTNNMEEFYTSFMQDGVNFVSYNETSQLRRVIEGLEADPALCKAIVQNNVRFVEKYLQYKILLSYFAALVNSLYRV
jgi:hypothetical protein